MHCIYAFVIETCECGTTAGGNTSIITSLQLCTGLSLSPCSCETGGCEVSFQFLNHTCVIEPSSVKNHTLVMGGIAH